MLRSNKRFVCQYYWQISALTVMQYANYIDNKPNDRIKYALN